MQARTASVLVSALSLNDPRFSRYRWTGYHDFVKASRQPGDVCNSWHHTNFGLKNQSTILCVDAYVQWTAKALLRIEVQLKQVTCRIRAGNQNVGLHCLTGTSRQILIHFSGVGLQHSILHRVGVDFQIIGHRIDRSIDFRFDWK